MVVKSSSAPSSPSSDHSDPLRGVQKGSSSKEMEMEFSRLKSLLPVVCAKGQVSKLDVILEAIRYIDQLQEQLVDRVQEGRLDAGQLAQLASRGGKENTELLAKRARIAGKKRKRQRHNSE